MPTKIPYYLKPRHIWTEELKKMAADGVDLGLAALLPDCYPAALALHVELLDTNITGQEAPWQEFVWAPDQKDIDALRNFGKVKSAISREVIVPGDITLHALHFVLQGLFGWRHSHLHNFQLPPEVLYDLTLEGSLSAQTQLYGLLFSWPDQERYYDDDYAGQSERAWYRSKYRGPYRSAISPKTGLTWNRYREQRSSLADRLFSVDQVGITASRIIKDNSRKGEWKSLSIPYVAADLDDDFYWRVTDEHLRLLEENVLCDLLLKPGQKALSGSEWLARMLVLNNPLLSECYEPFTLPCAPWLLYQYDYGDNWRVAITCTESYRLDKENVLSTATGRELDATEQEAVLQVAHQHLPRCTAADGSMVMDDVFGVGGFCRFLRCIHPEITGEKHPDLSLTELRDWAYLQGWKEKMPALDKLL
ncbi:MAG: hypothetical protein IJ228_04575 [Succinivibrio sp.]|nr:hypothetical protein [Succinivibrio sp.]